MARFYNVDFRSRFGEELMKYIIKSQYADFVGDSNNRTEELGNTARVQK